jgi:nucleotide-binding universal stress UspA family protein
MMRVLLATDGSESANNAVETVRSLALPAGSVVHLVAVLPSTPELFGAAWDAYIPGDAEAIERQMVDELDAALDGVKARLERPGVTVEEEVLRGRAATRIVEAANAFQADIAVVGSRGLGAWKRLLLGSVSAEIVDHASCPILVARRPSVGTVILGDDGSEGSRAAAHLLARFPALAGNRVKVVAVAEILNAAALGFSPAVSGAFMTEMIESTAEAEERLGEVTQVTAAILGQAGIRTETEVLAGDPAHELVRLARASEADLVVVGTTGLTGVARAVLGSVARNVLINARCSVLVVHRPPERTGS